MLYAFDIDGTLIRSFIREVKGKHGSDLEAEAYDQTELLPGRYDRLKRIAHQEPSARFAMVTNQAGVALGFQTEAQVYAKLGRCCAELDFFWGHTFSVHVAFEHPKPKLPQYQQPDWAPADQRRKPGAGMLKEAMAAHFGVMLKYEAAVARTVFVGDMDTDRQAAAHLQIKYYDAEEFFNER